jgi:hypothetical protein
MDQEYFFVARRTAVTLRNADVPLTTTAEGVPGLRKEIYSGISGTSIGDLITSEKFKNGMPDSVTISEIFEHDTPEDNDEYGLRFLGYVVPPETGDYTFWIAGDDNCRLYLQTDSLNSESTSNLDQIASVGGWTNYRQWDKYDTQQSAPVYLVKGKRYYVEALMKEHGGGDHVSVRWRRPGGTIDEPIGDEHLRAWQPGD